jgi:TatD DNase family protein
MVGQAEGSGRGAASQGAGYFDSHCHLQDPRFSGMLEAVLSRAFIAGVRAFVCCGTCEDDWQSVKQLALSHKEIVPSFGLHPWFVDKRSKDWRDRLAECVGAMPGSCVGEIGLDHACDSLTFSSQEEAFREQLRLAASYGRPVTIHCRKAFGRLVELLRLEGGMFQGGILHSYSGPPDMVRELEALGLSISFSGSVTFLKSKRARASAGVVSADRLLIETDSPDIRPYGCAAALNEPAHIVSVAEALSSLIGIPKEDVAQRTWRNAARIFAREAL